MLIEIQAKLRQRYQELVQGTPERKPAKKAKKPLTALQLEESKELLGVAARLPESEALKKKAWINASSRLLKTLGLPSHHDRQKDWDSLKTLHYVLENTHKDSPVLDAGSGSKSVILNWLHMLGYTNLWACDRIEVSKERYEQRNIRFSVEDLAKTSYDSESFAAISCVSVIEHGVDLKSFFLEMSRVLKKGGVLTVSTDYWSEPIDCKGVYPYGEQYGEMKVFTKADGEQIVKFAEAAGLKLCGPADFSTEERAVRWDRVNREYTFLFLAFRK